MALIVKRYLVTSPVADPCVETQKRLEKRFLEQARNLKPGSDGVTFENYLEKNMALINAHNAMVQKEYCRFAKDLGIAPALSSTDLNVTFDNLFEWDVTFSMHSDRLFLEARSISEDTFPIKRDLPFLRELDEEKFYILSGQRTEL